MAGKLASRVRGLSEAQFREAYGTEAQCRAVVEKLRWPLGFVCPICGAGTCHRLSTRPKIQCGACRHQTSLTAGTIFHATSARGAGDPVPQGREPDAREGCR
jgi:hypothetical protein